MSLLSSLARRRHRPPALVRLLEEEAEQVHEPGDGTLAPGAVLRRTSRQNGQGEVEAPPEDARLGDDVLAAGRNRALAGQDQRHGSERHPEEVERGVDRVGAAPIDQREMVVGEGIDEQIRHLHVGVAETIRDRPD